MDVFVAVFLLLILSRIGGELAERVGQPALAGELIAGVALGVLINLPTHTLEVLSAVKDYEGFKVINEFAMFFLMLMGGIELRPADLVRSSARSIAIGLGGFLLPLVLGTAATWVLLPPSEARMLQALFVGVALAVTAIPVSVKVLMDLGQLDSRWGRTIVAAALIDDVLSIVLLAILTALARTGGVPNGTDLAWLLLGSVFYLAATCAIARYLLPLFYARLSGRVRIEEFELSMLLIIGLAFAAIAPLFGQHFILGPFVAGLFFGQRSVSDETYADVRRKVHGVTAGFLAPLFFVGIGLHVDLRALFKTPLAFVLLLAIAFAAKIAGCSLPARVGGFGRRAALAIGIGMSGRGAVELIIADIALRSGVFSTPDPTPPVVENLFGVIVLIAVITTVATPILLRQVVRSSASLDPTPRRLPAQRTESAASET